MPLESQHQPGSSSTGEDSTTVTTSEPQAERAKKLQYKACEGCRSRKVQCDIYKTGPPCTYCRLYDTNCITAGTKYRKRKRQNTTENIDSVEPQSNTQLETTFSDKLSDVDNLVKAHGLSFLAADGNDIHHVLGPSRESMEKPAIAVTGQTKGTLTPTPPCTSSINASDPLATSFFPLPSYIKPLAPNLQPEDIRYLWMKGAPSLPNVALRDKLVEAYIRHVYPSLPLIDLQQFVRILNREGKDEEKISLILFQAIMFAGAAFIDLSDLQMVGYSTRREARKAFYQKTRLLYQFDCESDRFSIVQALLLITYQHENPSDGKDERYWLSVAISLAYTIGLHRNPDALSTNSKDWRLRKRTWWSCVMRDRLLALGMKKVPLIDDRNYDVPMLSLDDFEPPADQGNLVVRPEWGLASDTSLQRQLAMVCILKAKLCVCIGHILQTQYVEFVRDQGMDLAEDGRTLSRAILTPKTSSDAGSVQHCEAELDEWFRKLPPICQYITPTIEDLQQGSSIIVERALLHMIYHSASCTLHRPQVLSLVQTSSQIISQDKIHVSTRETTKLILDLHNLNLTRYLPATAVTVLIPLVAAHLMDIKFANDETRKEAIERLSRCMSVLKELREKYSPADDISEFLETVVAQANINIKPESVLRPHHSVYGTPESQSETNSESRGIDADAVEDSQPSDPFDNKQSIPQLNSDLSTFQDTGTIGEVGNMDLDFQDLNFTAASYADDLSFLFDGNAEDPSSNVDPFRHLVDPNMYFHNAFGLEAGWDDYQGRMDAE
ncbi:hypothetical protein B7463_g6091, partial [Scytalidium lignicola]